jgi:hypothetical protein
MFSAHRLTSSFPKSIDLTQNLDNLRPLTERLEGVRGLSAPIGAFLSRAGDIVRLRFLPQIFQIDQHKIC